MPDLSIFGLAFEKTIVIFETSTLKFSKNESLTNTGSFGIGFTVSKGPRSAFSDVPSPGPLYKVCTKKVFKTVLHVLKCKAIYILIGMGIGNLENPIFEKVFFFQN